MSKPTNDGGPAFPEAAIIDCQFAMTGGMTLRDWFAGQALAGMLSYPGDDHRGSFHNNASPEDSANYAYKIADAMLAAREGKS